MKKAILFLVLLFAALANAQTAQEPKVLHVSTIPQNTDIYINNLHPDHADMPDCKAPAFIPISGELEFLGMVRLHLFHPEFKDTTIQVTLSPKDTSYLVVSMRPIYDEEIIEKQHSAINKRGRRNIGYKLMFASIVPFVASSVAGAITYYQIGKADDAKEKADNSLIKTDSYNAAIKDFHDAKDKAKTAKATTIASLAIGASLLTIGFVLSF